MAKYKIIESNHEGFLKINGTRAIGCGLEKMIKDGKADYYYIECDGKFYGDFPFFKEDNEIGIYYIDWEKTDLIESAFEYFKDKYDIVRAHLPADSDRVPQEFIESTYKPISVEPKIQQSYVYNEYTFKLK